MSDLQAIVYVSAATHLLAPAEIDHLLRRARERNAEAGVTGLLLYSDGSFMQYIEGPRDELQCIYAIILKDPLHHHIEELLVEPIAAREFADWSMAYRQEMLPRFMKPPGWWQTTGGVTREPIGQGKDLLRSVWATFRGP
jgi:Sensors of blue-light using FAD